MRIDARMRHGEIISAKLIHAGMKDSHPPSRRKPISPDVKYRAIRCVRITHGNTSDYPHHLLPDKLLPSSNLATSPYVSANKGRQIRKPLIYGTFL